MSGPLDGEEAPAPTRVSDAAPRRYDLQVEEGTAFGKWYDPGEAPLPSFERAAEVST